MEKKLICVKHHRVLGTLEYLLTETYSNEFPLVPLYGAEIRHYGTEYKIKCVNNVECNKDRMVDFIHKMAKGFVTTESLFDVCSDYVEMLTDIS